MNKRILFSLTLIALLLSACCPFTRGSGKVVTETREVSNFSRVSLSGSGELTITQGDQESLEIEAEDNIMLRIKTEVKGETLFIGIESIGWWNVIPTRPIKFYLSMKDIASLDLSGSGNVNASSIETERLDVAVSGSGDIAIDSLTAEKLEVDISGSGNVTMDSLTAEALEVYISGSGKCNLAGQVTEQEIDISSSGKYLAAKLESQTVTVKVSGSGNVTVWASDTLDVKISGSGNVEYYGDPDVTQDISGSGSLKSLGNP